MLRCVEGEREMSEQKPKYVTNATPNTPVYCMRCGLPKNIPPYSNTLATKLCTCPPEPAPVSPTPKLTALDLAVIIDTVGGTESIRDNGTLFHYTVEIREQVRIKLLRLAASLNVKIELEAQDDKLDTE
jgi:hypothetical protein